MAFPVVTVAVYADGAAAARGGRLRASVILPCPVAEWTPRQLAAVADALATAREDVVRMVLARVPAMRDGLGHTPEGRGLLVDLEA